MPRKKSGCGTPCVRPAFPKCASIWISKAPKCWCSEGMLAASGEKCLPVAILAGGLATRMRPVTERIPKALIEVAGLPFVAHQLALLRREGVERVVLCVGFLGEMIEASIGDGARFGLSVAYSFDGEKLLGTGGALRHAQPMLGEQFFVLYGDSYLDIAYAPVQAAYRNSG